MNDRYFDEVIRVKLEAMMDTSAVDEAALEEVLDVADQLNVNVDVSNSWWSQWSSALSGNVWWIGALSGLMIAGMCWWVLIGTEPPPVEDLQHTEQMAITLSEEEMAETEEKKEADTPPIPMLLPDPIPQYQKSESIQTVDSLPVFPEDELQKNMPLPVVMQLKKMPILSIADIKIKHIPLKPVPIRLILPPQKKAYTEPPTYHSPSHPNKKRTSKTRPSSNNSKRNKNL